MEKQIGEMLEEKINFLEDRIKKQNELIDKLKKNELKEGDKVEIFDFGDGILDSLTKNSKYRIVDISDNIDKEYPIRIIDDDYNYGWTSLDNLSKISESEEE